MLALLRFVRAAPAGIIEVLAVVMRVALIANALLFIAAVARDCRTVADCAPAAAYAWCYAGYACDPNTLQCTYTPQCPAGATCVPRTQTCASCVTDVDCAAPAGVPWCDSDRYCNATLHQCLSRPRCKTAQLPTCNSATHRCDSLAPSSVSAAPVQATWGRSCTTQTCCTQSAAAAYPHGVPWCAGVYSVDPSGVGCQASPPCAAGCVCGELARRCDCGVRAVLVSTPPPPPPPPQPFVIDSSNWWWWLVIAVMTAVLLALLVGIFIRASGDRVVRRL
jgi:hypothetical protein